MIAPRILIVGAGFSGALLATHLLRRTSARVTLLDRSGVFGRGAAYAAMGDVRQLNVRSGRMSAFDDDPDHFVRWLSRRIPDQADPNGFASRSAYGAYVSDIVREAGAEHPGRLLRRAAEVVALTPGPGCFRVRTQDGRESRADMVVLALGNFPPSSPDQISGYRDFPRYVENPAAPGQLDLIGRNDDVAVLGSGLTAVDMLLELDARGWVGKATLISRRGLAPQSHAEAQFAVAAPPPAQLSLSRQLKAFRDAARRKPWPELMDELRPHGQVLWSRLTLVERRRFLRHLRPWWDAHRHRIAPEVAAQLARLRARGRLSIVAGKVQAVRHGRGKIELTYRPRGEFEVQRLATEWLLNCTGPELDPARVTDPFLEQLLDDGVARRDALGLGLNVGLDLRIIDRAGRAHAKLFAMGPCARGEVWEALAVPDIRVQALSLAKEIARTLEAGAAEGTSSSDLPCADPLISQPFSVSHRRIWA